MDSPLMMYMMWLKENQQATYDEQYQKLLILADEEKFQIMAAYLGMENDSDEDRVNKAIDYYWETYPSHPSNELTKKYAQMLKLIKDDEQNSGN